MKKYLALSALMAAIASPATAQMAAPAAMGAPMSSAQFRQMAMASDFFEIESSRIALQKSRNPGVRSFANMMIQDHSATSAALGGGRPMMSGGPVGGAVGGAAGGAASGAAAGGAAAGPVGAAVGAGVGAATGATAGAVGGTVGMFAPGGAALDPRKADMLNQLAAARPGPGFDRMYMTMQVAAHQEAVALFSSYAQSGYDSGLRSFAAQALPALQEHLAMAQRMTGGRRGARTRVEVQ
jgi:predicted outer membrane protein